MKSHCCLLLLGLENFGFPKKKRKESTRTCQQVVLEVRAYFKFHLGLKFSGVQIKLMLEYLGHACCCQQR